MKEYLASQSLVDRDHLIEKHRTYVRALAIKIMQSLPVPVDLQELIAYGSVGLIEAAERFDPRRGVAFSTFSHYRIKGAIYDGLREMGVFSRSTSTHVRRAANAGDLLQSAADDEPANRDAARTLDDEIAGAQSIIESLIPVYLLSFDSDSVPEIVDTQVLSQEQVEQRELISFMLELLRELSPEEQQLIEALYFKHRSMTNLASEMGVSKSWISRLHSRAIQRLRELMRTRGILED